MSSGGRYLHFSVFSNVKGHHHWSFENRVVVSVDTKDKVFNCKCCKSQRSCMHKYITKWAIAQWQPWVLGVQTSDGEEDQDPGVMELEDASDGDASCTDVSDDEIQESMADVTTTATTPGLHYPPTGDVAVRLSKYLYERKNIPAVLPLSLPLYKSVYWKYTFYILGVYFTCTNTDVSMISVYF